MNNKAIIEFGFRMILRIMQIYADHTQPHPIIANYSDPSNLDPLVCSPQ